MARGFVFGLTAICFVAALLLGHDLHDRLVPGDSTPIGASSTRADALVRDALGGVSPDLVLIARAPGSVDTPQAAEAGRRLTGTLTRDPAVREATSYWQTRAPSLRSRDGRSALVLVHLDGDLLDRITAARRISAAAAADAAPLSVSATGDAKVWAEGQDRSESDLLRAELIAAPLTLVILLVVFGSVVAAVLPVLVGVLAVTGAMAVLRILTAFTEVSVFALNIAVALGFALAVDFSLFVVTRFREELARGHDAQRAVAITMRTTGRAMAYSAATVALSLSALLFFPFTVLRSIGYGGIVITVLAAVASLVVLPAVLAALGGRVNALPVPGPWRARRRHPGHRRPGRSWARIARAVMRRPLWFAVPTTALLLTLGSPFLDARFATPDDRALPPDAPAARAAQVLRHDFTDGGSVAPTMVVLPDLQAGPDDQAALARLDDYAGRLAAVPGVTRVDKPAGSHAHSRGSAVSPVMAAAASPAQRTPGSFLRVVTVHEPYSVANSDLVRQLRQVPSPGPALFGGPGASLADTRETIGRILPLALALVALTTLVLVTALTGSPVLALKALVLNALSLTATFGVLVHIFQDGHLRWLVGDFTVTGSLDVLMPSMVFCVAFGLSMDYEIFLLSRITEEYRRTGDTVAAVAGGLQHTGRLFTSAAVIFAVVMAALATSGLSVLKMIGVGLAVAVLLDCTLIRTLLVPAVMRLAGAANWWTPLRRRHRAHPPA